MKPVSAALLKIWASRQWFQADLYTFSGGNLGSDVLRYCGGDADIYANGLYYPAGGQVGPYFDRRDNKAKCHQKIGTAADQLVFDVLPGTATVFGVPFLQALRTGQFDGAELTLERCYMPTYGDTRAGTLRMFAGRVAEIDAGRSLATFTVNSHMELLNLKWPRNLYQAGCLNNLGDAQCAVNLANYAVAGTTQPGSTASTIVATINAGLAGYFDQGTITFTSGENEGLTRSVRVCSFGAPGSISLIGPFPAAPAPGDAFTLYPGCDKSLGANGCPKFSNVPRFRGFPYVPVPETAV